jgi:hypothetical protein
VTGAPFAHVGGLPIEETLASLGPALLVGFGALWAKLRARRVRFRAGARHRRKTSAQAPESPVQPI